MSSRADSTSPPPYSFEVSSFPPPPPRVGETVRNWDFQAKFEAADEPVRQAVLDTITAWTARPNPEMWDSIPRNEVQDAYENAAVDLKKALDFITDCGYTVYFDNDRDRRIHQHFWRLTSAGIERSGADNVPILSAPAFVADFEFAQDQVKRATLETFAIWKYNHGGEFHKPEPHEVFEAYRQAPQKLKVLLNWVLQIGSIASIQGVKDLRMFETMARGHLEASIAIKNKAQPII